MYEIRTDKAQILKEGAGELKEEKLKSNERQTKLYQ